MIRLATIGDAPAIARVHVDSWRASYRNILPAEVIEGRSVDVRTAQSRNTLATPPAEHPTWVADDQRVVVGFVVALLDRRRPRTLRRRRRLARRALRTRHALGAAR